MPRYFFHIADGAAKRDAEGSELKDLATAKCEAVKLAGQSICESADRFWENEEWRLTATDEAGLTLFCLHIVGIDAPAAMGRDPNMISAGPVDGAA